MEGLVCFCVAKNNSRCSYLLPIVNIFTSKSFLCTHTPLLLKNIIHLPIIEAKFCAQLVSAVTSCSWGGLFSKIQMNLIPIRLNQSCFPFSLWYCLRSVSGRNRLCNTFFEALAHSDGRHWQNNPYRHGMDAISIRRIISYSAMNRHESTSHTRKVYPCNSAISK